MDIWTAAKQGRIDVLEDIIEEMEENGKHLNITRWSGHTALHRAAAAGHIDCIALLLERGAEVDFKAAWGGHTPLHMAASNAQIEACQYLVERGAKWETQDRSGRTPMALGCDKGHGGELALLQVWVHQMQKKKQAAEKEAQRLAKEEEAAQRKRDMAMARLAAEQVRLLRDYRDNAHTRATRTAHACTRAQARPLPAYETEDGVRLMWWDLMRSHSHSSHGQSQSAVCGRAMRLRTHSPLPPPAVPRRARAAPSKRLRSRASRHPHLAPRCN
jgi:hypothetical protein